MLEFGITGLTASRLKVPKLLTLILQDGQVVSDPSKKVPQLRQFMSDDFWV